MLWKKRCASYKNQQEKTLCWSAIGNILTCKLSGTDAEKEFYKLRQKFGRELRKEKESAPRSGAGAGQIIYISDWPLFKDLEFLRDVIKPRQTKSNFSKKSITHNQTSSFPPTLPTTISNLLGKGVIQRPSPSPSPPATISNFLRKNITERPSPSPSPPTITTLLGKSVILRPSSSVSPSITISENSQSTSCSSPNLDLESNSFSESDGNSSMNSPLTSTSVASNKKRVVPAPDAFFVKKKKQQDDMVTVIGQYSENINTLTDKITKCIESSAPPRTQINQPEESLFLFVSEALARVPQEKRVSCIIEVLQVVQKYIMEK